MTEHRLDPLLQPRSIALLGASQRSGSPGRVLAEMVVGSGFSGAVFAVNPGYRRILDLDCYPSLDALPQRVEHVVIALGNSHLEQALRETIAHGASAATIYSSGILEQDSAPRLQQRLKQMALDAGLVVCGLNGMGFYSLEQDLYLGIFPRPARILKGGISYIAQSGSAFTTLCHNGCRLGFNLCLSSGNEMTTGVSDYMDWCLEQEQTRVIALFLETVRQPQAFVEALEKANRNGVPVVILKIGKSTLASEMALTHTGAVAGDHAAFEALCHRYGIIEVGDFDEMAAILMLLQSDRRPAAGHFAAAFESGGFRELVTDLAEECDLDFASISDSTRAALTQHLDPGLKAENPLDAWGSHERFEERFGACMLLLMQDPGVAAGAFISNLRDGYYLSEAIFRAVQSVRQQTGKPVALATCYSDLANATLCERAQQAGIPLITGIRETLLAFRHLFRYQQFRQEQAGAAGTFTLDDAAITSCQQSIQGCTPGELGEAEALQLLQKFSIPVVKSIKAGNESELLEAAATMNYPLVLKTAEPGINHKSDCRGVFVGIDNEAELLRHYRDLCQRLGSRVLLSPMIEPGVEIALGTLRDAQFGPIIMVAAGGVLVELIAERAVRLCPVDAAQAESMLASLKVDKLLQGMRGQPPLNRQALVESIVRLSHFAFAMRHSIAEIDINPMLVNQRQALAVDALIIPAPADRAC